MNRMDVILQKQFPTVLMPKYGTLEPLRATGDRFILGADAIKMEISRPWVHAVVTLTPEGFQRPLPYGKAPADSFKLRCGTIPWMLRDSFVNRAAQACPNEVGSWIVWNEHTREFSLLYLHAFSHGPAHLDYQCPELPEGTWLVADLHSHGSGAAFFSSKDDADDAGAVKVAMVLGRADGQIQWALRAELLGVRVDL
ncbi:MAG: PRTRC system protein A [Nitrospiraceae bacterium]